MGNLTHATFERMLLQGIKESEAAEAAEANRACAEKLEAASPRPPSRGVSPTSARGVNEPAARRWGWWLIPRRRGGAKTAPQSVAEPLPRKRSWRAPLTRGVPSAKTRPRPLPVLNLADAPPADSSQRLEFHTGEFKTEDSYLNLSPTSHALCAVEEGSLALRPEPERAPSPPPRRRRRKSSLHHISSRRLRVFVCTFLSLGERERLWVCRDVVSVSSRGRSPALSLSLSLGFERAFADLAVFHDARVRIGLETLESSREILRRIKLDPGEDSQARRCSS